MTGFLCLLTAMCPSCCQVRQEPHESSSSALENAYSPAYWWTFTELELCQIHMEPQRDEET